MVIFRNSCKIAVFWHFFRNFGSILTNFIKSSFVAFRNQLSMFVTHGTQQTHECNVLNRIESNCSKIFIKIKNFYRKFASISITSTSPRFSPSLMSVYPPSDPFTPLPKQPFHSPACFAPRLFHSTRGHWSRSYAESGCTDLFSFYRVSDATVHVHASSALVHLHVKFSKELFCDPIESDDSFNEKVPIRPTYHCETVVPYPGVHRMMCHSFSIHLRSRRHSSFMGSGLDFRALMRPCSRYR